MSYDIPIPFKESGNFVTTGVVNFTGSDLRPGLIDKAVSYAGDLSAITNPNLEYVAPSLRSLNQYGVDNDLTCVWDTVNTENFTSVVSPFKINGTVIVGGDKLMVTGTSYDGDYTLVDGIEGQLGFLDSFAANPNYLVYSKIDGSNWNFIIFSLLDLEWKIGLTDKDPSTWVDSSPIYTSLIAYATLTNNSESHSGQNRPQSSANIVYSSAEGYAEVATITSLSNDLFVGKDEFSYEVDCEIKSAFAGTVNMVYIRQKTVSNFIRLCFSGNTLKLQVKGPTGVETSISHTTGISVGTKYNIAFDVDADGDMTLYLDGAPINTVTLNENLDSSQFSAFTFEDQSNIFFKNFRYQDKVKYSGNSFIPESSLPEFPFIETPVDLISGSYPEVGDIQSLVALLSAVSSGVNFVINGLYWNGASWVTSDNSFAQSNDLSTISANASTFPVQPKNYTITGVFSNGSTRSYIDDITVQFLAQKYSEAISATHSLGIPFQEIIEIQTTVVKPDSEFVTERRIS